MDRRSFLRALLSTAAAAFVPALPEQATAELFPFPVSSVRAPTVGDLILLFATNGKDVQTQAKVFTGNEPSGWSLIDGPVTLNDIGHGLEKAEYFLSGCDSNGTPEIISDSLFIRGYEQWQAMK